MKKWIIGNPDRQKTEDLARECAISRLCASVLVSRGAEDAEAVRRSYNFDGDCILSDPFSIKDMKKAVDTIKESIGNGEPICIYGDYDCDGISATAILFGYLKSAGAKVRYHINERKYGFGLNKSIVESLCRSGIKLIITVDNGISAVEEVGIANSLGTKVVITDHHMPTDILPDAAAVVDPHREDCPSTFKDLCGCAVALKLIAAMEGGDYRNTMEKYSEIAAIATIADVMPLVGENRLIVKTGLSYLSETKNLGLKSLIDVSGVKTIDSTAVAFSIVPRINAAGRMADAECAAELLDTSSIDLAEKLAEQLDGLNMERKSVEEKILGEIKELIGKNPGMLYKKVLVVYGEGWHHGVIGIAASKLAEHFGKPVFLISDDGEEARGSARNMGDFSVVDALRACSELLTKYGGHVGAGGFSLKKENLMAFDDALQKYADSLDAPYYVYEIKAVKSVSPEEITPDAALSLQALEPFGEKNPQPVFLFQNAVITAIYPLSGGAHTKLTVTFGKKTFSALMFGKKTEEFEFKISDSVNILASLMYNEYGQKKSVDLRVCDIRLAGIPQAKYFNAKAAYEKWKRGGGIDPSLAERAVPTRDELVFIYNIIRKLKKTVCDNLFGIVAKKDISYFKLRIAVDIFSELGFVTYDNRSDIIVYSENPKKAPIEGSEIYKSIVNCTERGNRDDK